MFATKQSELTPAQRAHTSRVLWLLLAYVVILPPLIWLRAERHVGDSVLLAMAMIGSVPVLGIFVSWGRYLSDERDEYQQSVALQRVALATTVTMSIAVVWGFLQAFGLLPLVEAYWIPTVWVIVQGGFSLFEVFARSGGNA